MTKKGIVVCDTGPIISLAVIDKLDLLQRVFDEIFIPYAVWDELLKHKQIISFVNIKDFFQNNVKEIRGINELSLFMDYGESESLILCKEINANYLLIDDKKARIIAEELGVVCIGTIGVLAFSKEQKFIPELRPLFNQLIKKNRYYSKDILNKILLKYNEQTI